MALAGLVYRGEVFPRQEYRRCFEAAQVLPQREACRLTVRLLELAHDYSCEAQLAEAIGVSLDSEKLPDIKRLRERFAPKLQPLPHFLRKGSLELWNFTEHTGGIMSTTQDKNIIEITTLPSCSPGLMKNGWERLASRADAEGWPWRGC